MLANKNNLKSELTANIGVLDTSISITAGEWILWENDMVACLEHYENDVCTKREIIKITAKNNDTFTITRWFAVCIMNDETKQQWQWSQTFVAGDFLSLYLSKEIWESITQNIWINETALQTMVWHINAPRTHINDNCLSWKQSIDSAYNTKYWWLAWFGDASDGDLVITEDTFLDASREYNFNNLTICANATLRFCWLWVPTINVRNNFKNYWTIDMRAPYLQARNTELTDHRLFKNDKVSNKTDDLTQLWTEWWFYKWWSGAGWTASWSDASDWHGWNGWSGGAYDWINGWNGWTSWSFWTGGWWWFWMWKGWNGWTGACGWWNGWNWFYWWQWWNVTQRTRFNGGWWAGGLWVIRWWDAWWWVWSCDHTEMWNWWNAITNVYWLHLNARNIWNNLVTAKWWDGGNGGIYYRSWTEWWYAPSWWNGWNGANWWEIMVSYDTMHQQWTFDVSWWKGWIGGKIWFSSESYWKYEQPNWTDWTAWRVVFKNLNNPYIENFTLTNDEDNESILISWKDPTFKPSSTIQWKNTMIRVSTTNYPATITDWTLVVNETTKNQYETTPYSMSATNGVTYYFTAFAFDQSDTLIDVQTNSITADFERSPNANTFIYYPFTSNLADVMWNWNTWVSHWTITFNEQTWVTVNWWSWYVTGLTNWISNKNTYTQAFRAKWDWKIDNYWMLLWDSYNYNRNSAFSFELWWSWSNNFRYYIFIGENSATNMPASDIYDTNRHLWVTVANNWTYKTYKDCVLRADSSNTWTVNDKPNMNIWRSSYYGSSREAKWKIKNYVVETIARSESDIIKFFNTNKPI